VSGSAANIGHQATAAGCLGEPIQKMPIERFLGQLRSQMLGVSLGCRIVALTNIHHLRSMPNF
jgi:hypothetical protein